MSLRAESPIFVRTQALLAWMLTATRKFPRDQRFAVAQRLLDQAFRLEDALVAASLMPDDKTRQLLMADCALQGLKRSLALSFEMKWLSEGQWRHATTLAAEVGRLLGGWKKSLG